MVGVAGFVTGGVPKAARRAGLLDAFSQDASPSASAALKIRARNRAKIVALSQCFFKPFIFFSAFFASMR